MTWQLARPSTEDSIAGIPAILQGNWVAIAALLGVSHYTWSSALSGRHVSGQPGILFTGSQTQINAIASPVSGALALASGTGIEHYYSGAWNDIGRRGWSRARAYVSESIPFTACTTSATDTQTIIFDTEDYDELGEYNNTTGTFKVSAGGPYLIIASICLCANATCATTVTATPSGNEHFSQLTSPTITLTALGSADRVADWQIVGAEPTMWQSLADLTDSNYISGGTEGDEAVLGFAAMASSATLVKVIAGMASADCATVTVSARMRRADVPTYAEMTLQIGPTTYKSEQFVPPLGLAWGWRYQTWSLNPRTSAAWAANDLFGVGTSAISGFGFRRVSGGWIHVTRAWIKYDFKLKNYSLVSDASDLTYVWNSAYPSAASAIDIYGALGVYSGAFPYNMPISAVKIAVRAAGTSSDAIYGSLMFPEHVSIPGSTYSTTACAIDWVGQLSISATNPPTNTFTDQTASANDATANDVAYKINTGGLGVTRYEVYGHTSKFNKLDINVGTVGVPPPGGSFTTIWSYWNGDTSDWETFTVSDGTSSFTVTGTNSVSFTPPTNWGSTTSLTGSSGVPYYWVSSCTSAPVGSTPPCATQIWSYSLNNTYISSQVMCAGDSGTSAMCSDKSFRDYETKWVLNPCRGSALTATSWTGAQVNASGTSAISGFGYNFNFATSGASVSECKMYVQGLLIPQEATLEIQNNGSMLRRVHNRIPVVSTEIGHVINCFDTVFLTAGDDITISLTKDTYNDVVSAGTTYSYLSISRISGRCF